MGELERDMALSRRELLERAAYAAGMAGAASLVPADTLLQAAAKAKAKPLPKPRDVPIDHFVVVMMENRSFDHYFGWLGATGEVDGSQSQTYLDAQGNAFTTRHASTMGAAEWQGCGFADPGHGWNAGRAQLQGGFMAAGSGNDEFALTYYDQGELGFIHEAARAYTICDRWFCSQLGPTWPNRYYKWSGQSGGINRNNLTDPRQPPHSTLGHQWETIFDVLLRNNPANTPGLPTGLTARYYNSDLPFSAVWGPRAIPWTRPLAEYYADCAAGTLPNVAFVDPPYRDGGGFDGNSADEHPHGDVRLGQAWMADVVKAFVESPNYRRGALFIVYDEWGGFFDHVTPPSVPDDRQSADLFKDFGQMGFRIPAVVVSPWTRNRAKGGDDWRVDHTQYGTESILKLILQRFGLDWDRSRSDAAPMRVDRANSVGESFNWRKPDFEPPDLPEPEHIVSRPCEMGGGDVIDDQSAAAHESDLAALDGIAEQFGFAIGESKPSDLFRSPDGVRRSLAAS
jgi:phospholipase C